MHKTTAGKDLVFQVQSEFLSLKLNFSIEFLLLKIQPSN